VLKFEAPAGPELAGELGLLDHHSHLHEVLTTLSVDSVRQISMHCTLTSHLGASEGKEVAPPQDRQGHYFVITRTFNEVLITLGVLSVDAVSMHCAVPMYP